MAYRMTPARRAALRKAQAASARKRRGKGKGKLGTANRRARRNRNIALATGGLAGAAALAGYGAGYLNATKNSKNIKRGVRAHVAIHRVKHKGWMAKHNFKMKTNKGYRASVERKRWAGI